MSRRALPLTKYQALGNSYLVLDPAQVSGPLPRPNGWLAPAFVRAVCDVNQGIGAEGLLLGPLDHPNGFGVEIYNPDGSLAEKSGNGLRIFARHLLGTGRLEGPAGTTATLVTRIPGHEERVRVRLDDRAGAIFTLDVGIPRFGPDAVGLCAPAWTALDASPAGVVAPVLAAMPAQRSARFVPVSVGNPHCVCFLDQPDALPAADFADWDRAALRAIADEPAPGETGVFARGCNLQWAAPEARDRLALRIFERGAGPTPASGSSASAAAAAAFALGLVDARLHVVMPGGALDVALDVQAAGGLAGIAITGTAHPIAQLTYWPDDTPRLD